MSDLLRLATAGSVDDGKSTLVGRLLYDTKSVLSDQLAAVERVSRDRGFDGADLALLTDGLRAEREQGITIDVAYRYFATANRSFILADTPGHVQYTRNMVTGASTAELAVILVDARTGVVEQTRRHASVSALLGVPHVALAVNKMDLVDFDEGVFTGIAKEFTEYATGLGIDDVVAIPLSALNGDNVVNRSQRTPWYSGPTLLEHLEAVPVERDPATEAARLPVQYVIRPQTTEHPDFRGYAGRVSSGILRVGDGVVVQPEGRTTTVSAITTFDGDLAEAHAGQSVTVHLADDLDVARGDLIAAAAEPATVVRELRGTACWLSEKPAPVRSRVLVKSGARTVRGMVAAFHTRLDITTLEVSEHTEPLALNDIGELELRLAEPLPIDQYRNHRHSGAFLIIDEADGTTLAAGMVLALPELSWR
jgi:sulfate adenylyltransferase subunit 1